MVYSHCTGTELGLMGPKIFTTRMRRMKEGNIFSLFTLARDGGTPSQVRMGGTPHSELDGVPPIGTEWGTPHPGVDEIPPVQDWTGYPLLSRTGYGYLSPPCQGLDGVPPPPVRRQSSKGTNGT